MKHSSSIIRLLICLALVWPAAAQTPKTGASADTARAEAAAAGKQVKAQQGEESLEESVGRFKQRVQEDLKKKRLETGGDEKVMKEIEAFVIEKSVREYEKRLQAVITRKRDSLAMLAEEGKVDSVELAARERQLDSLEITFKKKKAEILSSPSVAVPARSRPETGFAPRATGTMSVRRDSTRSSVIVVGRQPRDKEERDKVDSLSNPVIAWLAKNFMSSLGTVEKIVGLELGMNFYLRNDPRFPPDEETQRSFHIGNAGFRLGLLFPLRTPFVVTYYKVRTMFHKAEIGTAQDSVGYTYLTGTNEIVVGKNFFLKGQPFEYIPTASIGYNNGIIVEKALQAGIHGREVHYFWFWTLGLMMKRHMEVKNQRFAVGLSVNFERAFVMDIDSDTKARLSICAIGSY